MVPQHGHDLQLVVSQSTAEQMMDTTVVNSAEQMMGQQQHLNTVMFGSQMVDKNSSTPYTDATQVSELSSALGNAICE
ncbi:hypothetical protein quinque_003729 [Culex quinquefasciatus]